jgi:hypothetical protein
VSGHQPCYLPWLGYFHKLYLCDTFVYMDTVQYLENDWNNRNQIRTPNGTQWLTVPIDRDQSSGKRLDQIVIYGYERPDLRKFWQNTHWRSICANYRKAPYFSDYAPELEEIYLRTSWRFLVDLCWHQFTLFLRWLGMTDKKVVRMSEVQFEGQKDHLVLDHCLKLGADKVVFGTHGRDYVSVDMFRKKGIDVYFQEYKHPCYRQRFDGFIPYMSILDLIFNHGPESHNIIISGNQTVTSLSSG